MKHLQLFEKKKSYWVAAYDDSDGNLSADIFTDEESAKNSILIFVNEYLEDEKGVEYSEDDIITDVDEAIIEAGNYYMRIDYFQVDVIDKVELPEELKVKIAAKKYNL